MRPANTLNATPAAPPTPPNLTLLPSSTPESADYQFLLSCRSSILECASVPWTPAARSRKKKETCAKASATSTSVSVPTLTLTSVSVHVASKRRSCFFFNLLLRRFLLPLPSPDQIRAWRGRRGRIAAWLHRSFSGLAFLFLPISPLAELKRRETEVERSLRRQLLRRTDGQVELKAIFLFPFESIEVVESSDWVGRCWSRVNPKTPFLKFRFEKNSWYGKKFQTGFLTHERNGCTAKKRILERFRAAIHQLRW